MNERSIRASQPKVPSFAPATHTLTSLQGMRAAGVRAGIKASSSPDVGLLVAAEPMTIAGVFTRNLFAAAPVKICREHLERTGGRARAIVVNSGNANACTGARGEADARSMCQHTARALGCAVEEVLVCSTGVIGVPLPMDRVFAGIDHAVRELDGDVEAGRRFLAAIQTTDAFAKEASLRLELPSAAEAATVAGVCKGAGMIQPNMATMLAFVGTDLSLSQAELAAAIPAIAEQSFNAVHVDTHTSTNDTFFLFSTGAKKLSSASAVPWQEAVTKVARRLAWLIARDGEGATKVTTIEVRGATSDRDAKVVAEGVATSALVRTALFGNDPNWGRFVSQVGNSPVVKSVEGLRCTLQGVVVFENGAPTSFDRRALSAAMASSEDVHLLLELTEGRGQATVMTADLGYRYVEVNAEYTT